RPLDDLGRLGDVEAARGLREASQRDVGEVQVVAEPWVAGVVDRRELHGVILPVGRNMPEKEAPYAGSRRDPCRSWRCPPARRRERSRLPSTLPSACWQGAASPCSRVPASRPTPASPTTAARAPRRAAPPCSSRPSSRSEEHTSE